MIRTFQGRRSNGVPTLCRMGKVLAGGSALKHVQVREYVRTLAQSSPPGTATPSERDLVNMFGVARMTVRQAMDGLVAEGLIERIPGRGTFVARPRRMPSQVVGFTEEMTRRGCSVESHTLLARLEQAGPGVARALEIREGDAVAHWRRLRRVDAAPTCVEDAWLSDRLVPELLVEPMPDSLYEELARRELRPTWAEDSISAGLATEEEALLLEAEPGTAVLHHSRRTLSGDRAVEVSRTVYRSDRYKMRRELGAAG